MKKIPTIFVRNPEKMSLVLNLINTGCEWVFNGEGKATRKYDGTCCLVAGGILFKRRELKKGKSAPEGFILADTDPNTGKTVGWVEVDGAQENRWHIEAHKKQWPLVNGTYELLGPKIQGNPEKYSEHYLLAHKDAQVYNNVPRKYNELKAFLEGLDVEGLVFHHEDGRMAKIKKRDFGLSRKQDGRS